MSPRTAAAITAMLVALAASALAQTETRAVEAAALLTGPGEREWILARWENFMGGNTACQAGESYHFAQEGELRIERCIEGQIVKTSHHWTVSVADEADIDLSFGDRTFDLRFREVEGGMEMRLREEADQKTELTSDLFFFFEAE